LRISALLKAGNDSEHIARHSLLMIIVGLAAGLSAYLYQLAMGILLTPPEYATLLSLTSLLLVVSVFGETITLTVAKQTSKLKSQGRLGAVNHIRHRLLKWTFVIGILTFLLVAAFSPLLTGFLKSDSDLYSILLFSSLALAFPLSSDWGVMQGLQAFFPLAAARVVWALARPALAVLLVYIGLGLSGGLAAVPLSYAVAFVVTVLALRGLSRAGRDTVETEGAGVYAGYTILALFSITMLANIDVVMAKHYLSPDEAGSYSAISVLGRICFYAPMGIALAMFPKTSDSFESKGSHRTLFKKAALLAVLIVAPLCLAYAVFPGTIVHFLFSDKYPSVAPNIFIYGLGMSFLSLSYLTMTYFLSIGKTRVAYPLVVSTIFQMVLITLFHSSIEDLVRALVISGAVCLALVLALFLIPAGKGKDRQSAAPPEGEQPGAI
jgi:O-antigen/teichoic acid export membrane protein